jgi:hypothetical protein
VVAAFRVADLGSIGENTADASAAHPSNTAIWLRSQAVLGSVNRYRRKDKGGHRSAFLDLAGAAGGLG